MIKGVNRRVVEITGMNNDYFEKAVLYIRPDKSGTSQTRLELEARCAAGQLYTAEDCVGRKKKLPFTELTLRLASSAVIVFSFALVLYIFI
ncbi:MAG: hypothetical protein IJF18_04485 [Oscillospiraceae bacterium]|nr:hypothetical protein [Oscillospiraceae bacterium]